MDQFSNHPHTGNTKKPRIRLVNKLTLVILTLTSLWAMWLVAPSKEMLAHLIGRSSSPEISLAFLQQMYIREPENREIIQQIIDNYQQLGQLDQALAMTSDLLFRTDGTKDWAAFDIYLRLLLEKSYQNQGDSQADIHAQLRSLINNVDYIPEAGLARKYADAAISLSMTEKSFEILLPHLQSGKTSYQELIELALQHSDYDSSLKLQLDAFREYETLDEAQKLFALFISSNTPDLSRELIESYNGKLSLAPDYLSMTIEHSKLIGNLSTALHQSQKLLNITPSVTLLSSTAELAISLNQLELAGSLLADAVARSNAKGDITRLHQIYRWQNDIKGAQAMSLKLLRLTPSALQLRNGIEESRALGDIYHESIFYDRLARNNQIRIDEYPSWLNALEKAQGTQRALNSVKRLTAMRPKDTSLIIHKARLYSYQSDFERVIEQWKRLRSLHTPSPEEAWQFYNAYVMTQRPKQALVVLTTPKSWLEADENYLYTVSQLAWETSNRKIARLSQNQLISISSNNIDVYRYLRLNTPLQQKDIDNLIRIYRDSGNHEALLAAIQTAIRLNKEDQLLALLQLAQNDPTLQDNVDILIYQAELANKRNEPERAFALYQQALEQSSRHTQAINGLLWLAINANDRERTARIYNRYKVALRSNDKLWLSFATAAHQIGNIREAEAWYQQLLLNSEQDVTVILNYASLLETQGQYDKAFKLRRYIAGKLTDELLQLDDGDISYRSLVALFAGEQFALKLAEHSALSQPGKNRTEELFQYYLANSQTDNVLFWHQRTALKNYRLADWQQLSVAIQRKDRDTLENLLETSLNLPVADKNLALQLTGQHQKAWQHGQDNIGNLAEPLAENQLRKTHINQHPDKAHSIRSELEHNSEWDITRYSLDYFAPHHDGNWQLGSDYQTSGTPEKLSGSTIDNETRLRGQYLYQLVESTWQISFDFADGLGDKRLGLTTSYETPVDDYWHAKFKLGLNNHIEASQLMSIAGQSTQLGVSLGYQPTARETVTLQMNWHDLETRFNDEIGQGWDFNFRIAEQFFFADPGWQVYGDISLQSVELSNKPLNGINSWHQGSTPLTSADFIENDYQRVAIGQRLWHGEPGIPGATVPSPRYWLDTSLGYNVTNNQPDLTLSSGLGWRVVGNDELFITIDWQSQDRNGDQSLKLSMGYYYSF